jgi:hypothetical protein
VIVLVLVLLAGLDTAAALWATPVGMFVAVAALGLSIVTLVRPSHGGTGGPGPARPARRVRAGRGGIAAGG